MQVWDGQYSSIQPITPSNSTLVNCRAILCITTAGTLVITQGPIGAPSAPQTIDIALNQLLPIELNQGIVGAASTAVGLYALA